MSNFPILRVKDELGFWHEIAAIKGDKGDTGGVSSVDGKTGSVILDTVSAAKQLLSSQYIEEYTPYIKRESPYSSLVSDELVGCTIGWNQLLPDAWYTNYLKGTINGITVTKNADLSLHLEGTATAEFRKYAFTTITQTIGHKYFYLVDGAPSNVNVYNGYNAMKPPCITTYDGSSPSKLNAIYIVIPNGTTVNMDISITFVDLTECLGANIADRLKAMGADGVAWCREWLTSAKHSYSALTNLSTRVAKKRVTKNGKTIEYPFDLSVELKGCLYLDNNNIRAAGDTYNADGTVTRNYAVVDLGAKNWTDSGNGRYFCYESTAEDGQQRIARVFCPAYASISPADWYGGVKGISLGMTGYSGNGRILICDPDAGSAADLKTSLNGVYLVYPLKTPTTEQANAFAEAMICGTEEFVDGGILSETRDVPVPVGHNSKYYRDLRRAIENIPEAPSANGTYHLKCVVLNGAVTYSWEVAT